MLKGTNVYVPPWGLVLTFSPAFTSLPPVTVIAQAAARKAEAVNVTLNGCTVLVLDSSGRAVGGLVSYQIGA
jgi:hypothetical protein